MKLSGFNIKNKLTNLKSLFDSSKMKNILFDFLLEQKTKHNTKISLYIPETLGKCMSIKKCKNEYKDYFKICKKEDWIGLYIYQHKYDLECEFSGLYKCVGTTGSGKNRERKEGKKYSNNAYEKSEFFGIQEMLKAPYKYKIHNSGRIDGINIIEDYSDNDKQIKNDKLIDSTSREDFLNVTLKQFKDSELSLYRYIKIDKKCQISEPEDSEEISAQEDSNDENDKKGCESQAGGSSEESYTNEINNDTYYHKYLKYKQKYLELKKFSK